MDDVDLIVRGVVRAVGEPFSRNFTLVTPTLVEVKEVIHGELDLDAITLLQRGVPNPDGESDMVLTGEEVILLMVGTDDGYDWPYGSGAGIGRSGTAESRPVPTACTARLKRICSTTSSACR